MIRLLIPLILIVLAIVLARRYVNAAPADKQKSRKIDVLLIAATIVLLILTLLHRMHWLGTLVPTVIMAGRKIAETLSKLVRHGQNESHSSQKQESQTPDSSGKLNEEEALKVLGLERPYSNDDVIEAHRKLIQKFHPDRGGNDYLAAKINDAKEFLLKNR